MGHASYLPKAGASRGRRGDATPHFVGSRRMYSSTRSPANSQVRIGRAGLLPPYPSDSPIGDSIHVLSQTKHHQNRKEINARHISRPGNKKALDHQRGCTALELRWIIIVA